MTCCPSMAGATCRAAAVLAVACLGRQGGAVSAADIVVFGDSWATEGRAAFEAVAASNNRTVKNFGHGGLTAKSVAEDHPRALADAVNATPGARFVWLTIGGDDAVPLMERRVSTPEIMRQIKNHTQMFLEPLFESFPDIKVVQFGYDLMGWTVNGECEKHALELYFECPDRDKLPMTPAFINCSNHKHAMLYSDYIQPTEVHFRGLGYNYTGLSLLGTLQAAAGDTNATTGRPDWLNFSPPQYYIYNCIHCNTAGFTIVFKKLWQMFFR